MITPSFSSWVMLQVEYVRVPPVLTFGTQLLIICCWIWLMFAMDFGLRRHFAEGCLANTPELVQGGSRMTISASPVSGIDMRVSVTMGWVILVFMRLVSFCQVCMRLAEKSTEIMLPWFCMSWARKVVLAPGAAQISKTVLPGVGFAA